MLAAKPGSPAVAPRAFSRRDVAALAVAGAGASLASLARATPSRLDDEYEPPLNIRALSDLYNRMTAPVRVNGHGPFPFMVDTGSNQSVVSSELARNLDLAIGPEQPLNGVAGVHMAPSTRADLMLGDRVDAGASLCILPSPAMGVAGILGLDRLQGRELTLDFRGKALRIGDSRPGRRGRDVVVKANQRSGPMTLVKVKIAGIPVIAFLDSGAERTMGNLALRTLALRRQPKARRMEMSIISVTGQRIMAEVAELKSLNIAGMTAPVWPVAFADLHTFHIWNLGDTPALLMGVDVLSRFEQVSLDFQRSEVRFRHPRTLGRTESAQPWAS